MSTTRHSLPLPERFSPLPRVVFTDVDDTLTHEGQLPETTFSAMHRLRHAGITVIPVTGACAGWCDCLIKTWPIAHIIGENGALTMEKNPQGLVVTEFAKDRLSVERDLVKLHRIAADLNARFPSVHHTQDQQFRLTDIAFDIGQSVTIENAVAQEATAWLKTQGVQVRRSSIHINVWIGEHSKSSGAKKWLRKRALTESDCLFIGDSPNDECMFEQFPISVGVANVARFLNDMTFIPTYITEKPGGLGFTDMAEILLR